jgi:cell shape-determining protein MreC
MSWIFLVAAIVFAGLSFFVNWTKEKGMTTSRVMDKVVNPVLGFIGDIVGTVREVKTFLVEVFQYFHQQTLQFLTKFVIFYPSHQ